MAKTVGTIKIAAPITLTTPKASDAIAIPEVFGVIWGEGAAAVGMGGGVRSLMGVGGRGDGGSRLFQNGMKHVPLGSSILSATRRAGASTHTHPRASTLSSQATRERLRPEGVLVFRPCSFHRFDKSVDVTRVGIREAKVFVNLFMT